MAACAADDAGAFAALVRRHEARLRGFLARSLPADVDTASEARDLCQEVFIEVWRARHRYQGSGRFVPWLLRIARSRAASRGRALAVRRLFARRADRVARAAPGDALAHLISVDDRDRVRRALDGLPRADREILALRAIWELDYGAIAEVTGVSVGAARVRVHRALTRLAQGLEERGQP
jgi:RNA polymerase sigma-70 factor (ECF subfamily)